MDKVTRERSVRELSALELIALLHSGDGAVVTLHHREPWHKDEKRGFNDLGGFTLNELRDEWDWLSPFLEVNGYFSINSMYRQPYRSVSKLTGLPLDRRRKSCLRWINAVWVDVDVHTGERFSFDEALAKFLERSSHLGLPMPNVIGSSGRGLWALWLLHDHANVGQRPKGHQNNFEVCERVNRALAAAFGGDPQSVDSARITRVPGTLNPKAPLDDSGLARFWLWHDATHSLPEIASILGVRAQRTKLKPASDREPDPKKRAAGMRRWLVARERFVTLWHRRRRFTAGTRHNALFVYGLLLRRTHVKDMRDQLLRLAASCDPPLDDRDVQRAIASVMKHNANGKRFSIGKVKIAQLLKITDEEKAAMPDWFPPPAPTKRDRIAYRRWLVRQELEIAGHGLSASQLARRLQERGVRITKRTLFRDLEVVGTEGCAKTSAIRNKTLLPAIAEKMAQCRKAEQGG